MSDHRPRDAAKFVFPTGDKAVSGLSGNSGYLIQTELKKNMSVGSCWKKIDSDNVGREATKWLINVKGIKINDAPGIIPGMLRDVFTTSFINLPGQL